MAEKEATQAQETGAEGKTEAERVDELVEANQPPVAQREQRIAWSDFDFDETYVQRPLSFFGKLEFTRLIGRALDEAYKEGGISIAEFSSETGIGGINDLQSVDAIVRICARLSTYAPELFKEIYLVALGVPTLQRDVVATILDQPYDPETGEGGLSDEDGFAILDTFVDQNAEALRGFFVQKARELFERTRALVTDQTPAQSKRSKRTRRTTPKR